MSGAWVVLLLALWVSVIGLAVLVLGRRFHPVIATRWWFVFE